MNNRPGELTKLLQFLAEERVHVSGITVASLDDVSSVEFSADPDGDLPGRLERSGLAARVAAP
jgi:hypothetical protein